ncbi:MAG: DASH family cryptochrome [Bacteroidia bacterium]|nr:DASH family cryptochrome [Bacteroidia bacterium]
MTKKVALWLLNDLRLHDHPALHAALQVRPTELLFVYVWGPPSVRWGKYSFPPEWPLSLSRLSSPRQRFLLQALLELSQRVHLVLLEGEPQEVIPPWMAQEGISALYAIREWAPEEVRYQNAVSQVLQREGKSLFLYEGNALYEREQLPFAVEALPQVFTRFRQLVERSSSVKMPLESPPSLPSFPSEESQKWLRHRLSDLPPPHAQAFPFEGGEQKGKEWLQRYFAGPLFTYKQTRNGFMGSTFSSHLSPWLAVGCLSPRWVYAQLRAAERREGANDSTYWLFFELLWREYFRWLMVRWRGKMFAAGGIRGYQLPWKQEERLLEAWIEGKTGYPIVDAAMRELGATGWTSNRARQIVASFLTKNLFLDWRWGAAYFETQLIDYDVYSNWGNWLYQAGVGTDGRGFRWFDPVRQAKLYDPEGHFIRQWVPELRGVSAPRVYMPDPGYREGLGYPTPVVDWRASLAYAKDTYWRTVQGAPKGNQLLRLFQDEET